jgi:predicted small lipoprotein YifL
MKFLKGFTLVVLGYLLCSYLTGCGKRGPLTPSDKEEEGFIYPKN